MINDIKQDVYGHTSDPREKPDDACRRSNFFMNGKIPFKSSGKHDDSQYGSGCRKRDVKDQKNRIINFYVIWSAK